MENGTTEKSGLINLGFWIYIAGIIGGIWIGIAKQSLVAGFIVFIGAFAVAVILLIIDLKVLHRNT